MPAEWSDTRKWWMELLKNAIIGGTALTITLTFVNRIDARRVRENAQVNAYFDARIKALDNFVKAGAHYDHAAHTAYVEMHAWEPGVKEKRTKMIEFETVAFPEWSLSMEAISNLFADCAGSVAKLRSIAESRYRLYHRHVVADRSRFNAYDVGLWADRQEFEAHTTKIRSLRSEIVGQIQRYLYAAKVPEPGAKVCAQSQD